MSSDDDTPITIDDVELAVSIIQKWVAMQNRVDQILSRVRPRSGGMGMSGGMPSFDSIVEKVMEKKQNTSTNQEAAEMVKSIISPEERKRMTKLATKFKTKPRTAQPQKAPA